MTRAAPGTPVTAALKALATAVAALALAACGGADTDTGRAPPTASGEGLTGQVTVLAAASLTEAFTALGTAFEAAHPGTTVVFSFGPSSGLARQITSGAPADVFAAASQDTMDTVVRSGAARDPVVLAVNSMQVAVPAANPAGISRLADLARPGVKVALCQAQVPCGSTAAQVFRNAGLTVTPVTEETDVKAVLTKVQLGEVDAGVVYRTDVLAAGARVRGIVIPREVNAATSYPVAALTRAPNPRAAAAFADFVLSPAGRAELARAGFGPP